MANETTSEVLKYLDEMVQATRAGKMIWRRENPTTFVWATANRGKIVLQRTVANVPTQMGRPPQRVSRYVLLAMDLSDVEQLQLQSTQGPDIDAKLRNLYVEIESSIARRGLDFLKSILPG